MTINEMRSYICEHPKYKKSVSWKARVERMPESQVVAIFKKFQKLNYRKIRKEIDTTEKENANYRQMTIFDLMKMKGDNNVREHE